MCSNNVLIICDNYKERCFICSKFVYKHQHIAVCCLDGRIFHGSCLRFNRDTCYHIQNASDWFCPSCNRDIFPFYDDFDNSDTSSLPCLCTFCKVSLYNNTPLLFNPFQFEYDSERDFNDFDDSMSEALNMANNILVNCNYSDTDRLPNISGNLSTFYFNNIDGFKTNFNEALVNINSIKTKPSLIAFCETNLKQDDIDDYEIKNYNSEHLYAKHNKSKGSGITIYYKNSHLFQRISSLDVRNNYFECMGGRFKTNDSQFYIIVVYRYHNNIKTFFESFMETISSYNDKPLLIIGDFNLDLLQFDTDPIIDEFVNMMISSSLFPLINKPTNFFRNSSTLIDHAWCNILHEDIKPYIINSSVSSHKPILTTIPTSIKQFTNERDNVGKHIRTHNVNEDTISAFSTDFESILSHFNFDTEFITDSSTIRSLFSNFYGKVSEIYCKHISVDKVLTSKRNSFDKPWITTGIAKACKVKNKLHNKWIKSRGSPLEEKCKKEYKLYRSRLRNIIREAELNHFRKKFLKTSGNIRKAWQVINSIRCKKKSKQFPNFIDINGTIITDRRVICNNFNDYFVNVANNLNRDKYINHDIPEFNDYLKDRNASAIVLTPISSDEIQDIIAKLNNYKANDISPLLLKPLSYKFSYSLRYLFNSCMLAGVFPNELKIAKVTPLYKSGNSNCMSNYRPISILPTLSKIFEKLLHKRIYNFLEHSNIIYDYQFGFTQGYSTMHAVQTAISSVITSLNSSYHSMGIFIDFSKAFDTIQHSILLKKLDHYGIRGIALDLIKDYLNNRKQYIFWDNNCSSSLMDITTGVPQGSVLGPLFFVIYVNDIINCTGNSVKVIMFADDTNIFISSRSLDDLYEQANEILLKLRRYIDANYLHINLKKSKYMCFRSKRAKLSTHSLFYDNFQLEQVQTIKFLGVFISDTLTWDEHIKHLTRKLSRISGSLNKLVRCILKDIIRDIYFALYYIREILSQGSTERLWNVCETFCYWLSARETQTNRSAVLSHMHHVNIHIIQQENASIAQFPFNPILQE